jgi:hypothetical protein
MLRNDRTSAAVRGPRFQRWTPTPPRLASIPRCCPYRIPCAQACVNGAISATPKWSLPFMSRVRSWQAAHTPREDGSESSIVPFDDDKDPRSSGSFGPSRPHMGPAPTARAAHGGCDADRGRRLPPWPDATPTSAGLETGAILDRVGCPDHPWPHSFRRRGCPVAAA